MSADLQRKAQPVAARYDAADRIEPGLVNRAMCADATNISLASIAISLKRIADYLEENSGAI